MSRELIQMARQNLRETYLGLASAAGATDPFELPVGLVVTGELPHAICNFALIDPPDLPSAKFLRDLGLTREVFNVYLLEEELDPEPRDEMLDAGFYRAGQLVQMAATPPVREGTSALLVNQVESSELRLAVAQFMMRTFFPNHRESIRTALAKATAASAKGQLYAWPNAGSPRAALMLISTPPALGLYNVCVSLEHRNRGLGAALVKDVLSHHAQGFDTVLLQCDSTLVEWYQTLGFQAFGAIDVYVLNR